MVFWTENPKKVVIRPSAKQTLGRGKARKTQKHQIHCYDQDHGQWRAA